MLTPEDLLERIRGYLSAHGVSATRFGEGAVGDPGFVHALQHGREPRRATVGRVLEVLDGRRDLRPRKGSHQLSAMQSQAST